MEDTGIILEFLDLLLLLGLVGLVVCVGGLYLALRTRDGRTIAISVSIVAIAIMLFASQWAAQHVEAESLWLQRETYIAEQDREEVGRLLEGVQATRLQRRMLFVDEPVGGQSYSLECEAYANAVEAREGMLERGFKHSAFLGLYNSSAGEREDGTQFGYFRIDPTFISEFVFCFYEWPRE